MYIYMYVYNVYVTCSNLTFDLSLLSVRLHRVHFLHEITVGGCEYIKILWLEESLSDQCMDIHGLASPSSGSGLNTALSHHSLCQSDPLL